MIKKILFLYLLLPVFLTSCSYMPDGKGCLVVESDSDDYTIKEVYARKAGEAVWRIVWSASSSSIDWTYANIYLDPGDYYVRAKMCWAGKFYTIDSTGFAAVCIKEGETTFLYARLESQYFYQ